MSKTVFSNNTIADAEEVNDNFDGAYSGEFDEDNNRLALTRQHAFQNFVVSGLTIATSASLNGSIAAGKAYVTDGSLRELVEKSGATAKTFTASKDTYVDMDVDGNFFYVEVANGATSGMTLTSGCIRIALVVTSGTAITSVSQKGYDPLLNPIYNRSSVRSGVWWFNSGTSEFSINSVTTYTYMTMTIKDAPVGAYLVNAVFALKPTVAGSNANVYITDSSDNILGYGHVALHSSLDADWVLNKYVKRPLNCVLYGHTGGDLVLKVRINVENAANTTAIGVSSGDGRWVNHIYVSHIG